MLQLLAETSGVAAQALRASGGEVVRKSSIV
jgi:hypothetical protein